MSNSTCVGDVEYWRRLNPQCSITASPWLSAVQPYELGADQAAQLVPKLKHEGFFVTPPVVSPQQLEKLADCITRVVDAGHRATYALLYDEFFHVLQGLERVMEPVLGPDYQLVADEFEAYCIPTSDSARGSPPHRDSLRNERSLGPDGMPNLVNVWIPLTDTTPANSCMYVLPAHLDPYYAEAGAESRTHSREVVPLQDVRALPARAGSVLCWSTHLLHWGGRSSSFEQTPRLSFAAYFQNRNVPAFHPATMDIPSEIPFDYRLYLVEKAWKDPQAAEIHRFKPGAVELVTPQSESVELQQRAESR